MPDKDIKSKIREWLSKGGFPLEMRVADAFGKHRFNVVQADYYEDSNTGMSREIDVYAYAQEDMGDSFIRLAGIIECKSDKSKPWIVFTSPRIHLADRARVVQRSATRLGDAWLRKISTRRDVSSLSVFRLPERPGYGVAAAFSEKTDAPYAALSAVAGAANAVASADDGASGILAMTPNSIVRTGGQRSYTLVQFPIVVTDAPIFECYFKSDDELELAEITEAVIVWRNPVYRKPHCIIHLVHSSKVEEFAKRMESDFRFLLEIASEG